jgi:hypothetical protein
MLRHFMFALATTALIAASLTATATTALAATAHPATTYPAAGHRADLGGGIGPNPGPGGHCRGQLGAGPGGYCGSEGAVPEPDRHHYGN